MAKQPNARFLRYMGPVIESLKSLGFSARPKQVINAVTERIDVPPEDLVRKTTSGQSIFENDVHWCRAYLVKAGFIDRSKRGVWTLTPKGQSTTFNEELIGEIWRTVQKGSKPTKKEHKSQNDIDDDDLEQIEDDAQRLEYRAQVLERLKKLSAAGFERFCRALLLEAGFEDVEVTGRSGDKGIDGKGTLKVNPLFSMKVAFQAKRYQDTVGSGVIRDFRGAIVGRADRGLIITTGTFTRDAETEAARDGAAHIELIDGPSIVDLMEQYEFGLIPVSTYEVNFDLFETFESGD